MKRVVGVALGLLACCSNLSAAGHLHFSNYNSPPYNQVVWDASVPVVGGFAVNNTSVQLQMWYGEGVISDENLLTPGETFTVHLALNANPYPFSGPIDYGPGGFFGPVVQVLPTYDISETFTFQLRASGNTPYGIVNESYSRSALWQETTSITYLPPSPPPTASRGCRNGSSIGGGCPRTHRIHTARSRLAVVGDGETAAARECVSTTVPAWTMLRLVSWKISKEPASIEISTLAGLKGMVEPTGIEPATPTMPLWCSTN